MRNARSLDDTTFQIYHENGTPIVGGIFYKAGKERVGNVVPQAAKQPAERINTNWIHVGKKRSETRARFVDQGEPEEADE